MSANELSENLLAINKEELKIAQRPLLQGTPLPYNNVSRIRHLSPFRYPGGKTWLVPYIRRWLERVGPSSRQPITFVEPFAGGASVSLMVADEQRADQVVMVELDNQVACVWDTILYGDWRWLNARIRCFPLTRESVASELNIRRRSKRQQAFQTILRNRVTRGGGLTKNTGFLREGEDGKGIASRWYPERLVERITRVHSMNERIHFIHGDGMEILRQFANEPGALFFIDPPYTAAGKKAGARLYNRAELDHKALFELTRLLGCRFLMTYDDSAAIRQLVREHDLLFHPVSMKTTNHHHMTELLIGRSFDWLDRTIWE